MKNKTLDRRKKFRDDNKKRIPYFRQYYSGERYEKQKEDALRTIIMKTEAGYSADTYTKKRIEKRKTLLTSKRIIFVEGKKLIQWTYALDNLINNLSPSTVKHYVKLGYIPKPIYKIKRGDGHWYYYSIRQVRWINLTWQKKRQKQSLRQRIRRLHENWTKGELGFEGSEGDY